MYIFEKLYFHNPEFKLITPNINNKIYYRIYSGTKLDNRMNKVVCLSQRV